MHQDVINFMAVHSITLPRHEHWYPVLQDLQQFGSVQGLPQLCGIPKITNGIDVYLEQQNGNVVMVHWKHFTPYPKEPTHKGRKSSGVRLCDMSPEEADRERLRRVLLRNGMQELAKLLATT